MSGEMRVPYVMIFSSLVFDALSSLFIRNLGSISIHTVTIRQALSLLFGY